ADIDPSSSLALLMPLNLLLTSSLALGLLVYERLKNGVFPCISIPTPSATVLSILRTLRALAMKVLCLQWLLR
ncbi:hypothetical protein, partial [Xanthomonas euvesicatoria]|uniref:hypothetical protein n=1 Tax=Xanthomonas euvesicatoria TaxID=456327 RepID=UPI0019D394A2